MTHCARMPSLCRGLLLATSALVLAPSMAGAICVGCTPSDRTELCAASCRSGGYTISVQKDNQTGVTYLVADSSDKYEYGDFYRAAHICHSQPGPNGCPPAAVMTKVTDNAKAQDAYCRVDGSRLIGTVYKIVVTGGFSSPGEIALSALGDQCPNPGADDPALLSRLRNAYNAYAGNRPHVPECNDIGCAYIPVTGDNIDNHANFGEHGWADPAYHWDDTKIKVASGGGRVTSVSQTKDQAAIDTAKLAHAKDILGSKTAQSCLATGGQIAVASGAGKKLGCYGATQPAGHVASVGATETRLASDCWSRGGAITGTGGKIGCAAAPSAGAKPRT